jgi:hypothetical protein
MGGGHLQSEVRMRRRVVLLLAALLLVPLPARAWHNRGHNAVARIAWQKLIDDGLGRKAIEILSAHPHKELFLLAARPEGVEADEWMFVQAATWSDWVRRPVAPDLNEDDAKAIVDEFSKSVWHYVNLPYIHPSEAGNFDEAALREALLKPELDAQGSPRHVLAALRHNADLLRSAAAAPKDRAVALCWLSHLTGDLHQPLHAVGLIASRQTLQSEEFLAPSGDQGGNRHAVRTSADEPGAMTLHFFWDSRVFADLPYETVQARVHAWLHDAAFQRSTFNDALRKTEFQDWAEESLSLAKDVVYRDGGQFLKTHPLPEKTTKADFEGLFAPVLSEQYQQRADVAAQRRLVLAGYRLGDLLAFLLANREE